MSKRKYRDSVFIGKGKTILNESSQHSASKTLYFKQKVRNKKANKVIKRVYKKTCRHNDKLFKIYL